MPDFYNTLLAEMPRIAAAVEHFPENIRKHVFDTLVDELRLGKHGATNTTKEGGGPVKFKNNLAPAIELEEEDDDVLAESESAKKLSKLRAKIFEKTTAVSVENTDNDPIKAGLEELSTQDLSNIVFYQKGKKTPLSDML